MKDGPYLAVGNSLKGTYILLNWLSSEDGLLNKSLYLEEEARGGRGQNHPEKSSGWRVRTTTSQKIEH